jgi:hypothetical protein
MSEHAYSNDPRYAGWSKEDVVAVSRQLLAEQIEEDAPLIDRVCTAVVIASDAQLEAAATVAFGAIAELAACTPEEAKTALLAAQEQVEAGVHGPVVE